MGVAEQNTLFFIGLMGILAMTIVFCQIRKRRK